MQMNPSEQVQSRWRFGRVLLMIIGVGYIFVFIGFLIWFTGIAQPSAAQGAKRADEILLALEQYRQEQEKYPTHLEKLTPDFIEQIPSAGWWYGYHYHVCTGGARYILYFPADGQSHCLFTSHTQEWQCIQSGWSVPPLVLGNACLDG